MRLSSLCLFSDVGNSSNFCACGPVHQIPLECFLGLTISRCQNFPAGKHGMISLGIIYIFEKHGRAKRHVYSDLNLSSSDKLRTSHIS